MAAFDAPSRDVCAVQRTSTNTPLQALVTLHSPTFVEAARILAEDIVNRKDPIRCAFRRILSRQPTKSELSVLENFQDERLIYYRENPPAAGRLLQIGESPVNTGIDPIPLATLTDVCHTIFNLSEAVTRK
jgi:hypothetical protein